MSEIAEETMREFERVRRSLPNIHGLKAVPVEREYARLYDRLCLLKVGGRRRLRSKYRG